MMHSPHYIKMIQRRVIPKINPLFPDGSGVFQQDLTPCHTSKQVKKFMYKNHIELLEWPGNSFDLNPIENMWSICKQRLRTMVCTSKEKLIQVWYRFPEIYKIVCSTQCPNASKCFLIIAVVILCTNM